ncbi:unnamed protein product [Ranitomeya imitator]|uniref:Uncharacterized protein n=1 Tax=Ranitomeya imitator TaxID=111125 RepID=A0ABN9LJ02_9NEOB|nr:unnamed protein product [Ranitomeya imitator]
MDEGTPPQGEKSSKISDLISRFEGSSPGETRKESPEQNNGPTHRTVTKVILQPRPFTEHPLLLKQSVSVEVDMEEPKPKHNGVIDPDQEEYNQTDALPSSGNKIETQFLPTKPQELPTPRSPIHGPRGPSPQRSPIHSPRGPSPQRSPIHSPRGPSPQRLPTHGPKGPTPLKSHCSPPMDTQTYCIDTQPSSPGPSTDQVSSPSHEGTEQDLLNGEEPQISRDKNGQQSHKGIINVGYQETEPPSRLSSVENDLEDNTSIKSKSSHSEDVTTPRDVTAMDHKSIQY